MSKSSADRQLESVMFIKGAIDYGVLTNFGVWDSEPAIVIACPGTYDKLDRDHHLTEYYNGSFHPIRVNGGGHRLDSLFPTNQRGLNWVPFIIDQIDESRRIMQRVTGRPVKRLMVFFDYLCVAVDECEMGAEDTFRTAVNVKNFLRERYPNLKIGLEFYLDNAPRLLGRDHRLIVKNPQAPALTFHLSSDAASTYIDILKAEETRTVAG